MKIYYDVRDKHRIETGALALAEIAIEGSTPTSKDRPSRQTTPAKDGTKRKSRGGGEGSHHTAALGELKVKSRLVNGHPNWRAAHRQPRQSLSEVVQERRHTRDGDDGDEDLDLDVDSTRSKSCSPKPKSGKGAKPKHRTKQPKGHHTGGGGRKDNALRGVDSHLASGKRRGSGGGERRCSSARRESGEVAVDGQKAGVGSVEEMGHECRHGTSGGEKGKVKKVAVIRDGRPCWAITELNDDELPPSGDDEEQQFERRLSDVSSRSSASSGDIGEVVTCNNEVIQEVKDLEKEEARSLKKPPKESPKFLTEEELANSDAYDTDLEEDFPPEEEHPPDNTGKYVYESKCKDKGVVPVKFLIRNLGEGNLRMRHHYLGGEATKPLAQALRVNTVCEEIDLSDNYLEGAGAAALASVLKDNMFIVNLNISNNFIRAVGAKAFSEMLEMNTTLKTLSLKGNQLSDSDAESIANAMKNNMSLSCLDLSYNNFGENGGVHLGAGLAANIGLSDLDLSWNCLSRKGAVAVCKAIAKNQLLEIFDLSWNGISDAGATALANSLKVNKSLKVLDISNNRIGLEGAKKLAQGIAKNQGLETLLMGTNPIQEEGMEAILKGIIKNTSLKLVGLEDICISKSIQDKIKDLTESRDIMMMYSSGGPQQSRMNQTILAVFDRFISENADRMEDLFNQMDKDKSGDITLEEFKYGLKDFGLRLTSKQLDALLDELDADKSGTIELEELLAGSALIDAEKQKKARAEMEEALLQESANIAAAAAASEAAERLQRAKENREKLEQEGL